MTVWLLLVVVVATLLYYYVWRRYRYWRDRGIAELDPSFPLGDMKGVGTTRGFIDMLDEAYGRVRGKSAAVGVYFLISPILIVADLDLAKQILVKDFHLFHDRGMYVNERDDPLSGHLFSIGGERWRYLRNKLSPTFTSGKIKSMFVTIREIGDELLASFDKYIDCGDPIDIKLLCQCFTCDVVGSCAFGLQCNSLKNGGSKLLEIGDKVFKPPAWRNMLVFALISFKKLAKRLRLPVLPGEVTSFFMPLVTETVADRERNSIERPDFLNLLIQLKNKGTVEDETTEGLQKLTLDEVAAQAFVFFFAGFETSSTTLSFALFELANNPDIQQRVRTEVLEKLQLHDGKITYDALKEMTYLDQVINETLRMYPPVPQLIRVTTQPYQVEGANVTLEPDTMLMIPIYAIHHDASIYPDPERFDPDRFALAATHARHTHAFLPFGDGPRNCIGMRFGLLEVKFGIVQMVSKLRFTVSERMQMPLRMSKTASILEAEGGIWLNAAKL
ncbi:cytochrome P450 6a2-like isoform X3 [Anopheles merus]|uniref:cytochrome P450 6a2-like isoform X3 n=1 Tax=Anopheles merus TaxID=30066 RepID=UPI001BE4C01C|nr:cytochrome P450 6a2-like isoform X3 [Anopheles merus]